MYQVVWVSLAAETNPRRWATGGVGQPGGAPAGGAALPQLPPRRLRLRDGQLLPQVRTRCL